MFCMNGFLDDSDGLVAQHVGGFCREFGGSPRWTLKPAPKGIEINVYVKVYVVVQPNFVVEGVRGFARGEAALLHIPRNGATDRGLQSTLRQNVTKATEPKCASPSCPVQRDHVSCGASARGVAWPLQSRAGLKRQSVKRRDFKPCFRSTFTTIVLTTRAKRHLSRSLVGDAVGVIMALCPRAITTTLGDWPTARRILPPTTNTPL